MLVGFVAAVVGFLQLLLCLEPIVWNQSCECGQRVASDFVAVRGQAWSRLLPAVSLLRGGLVPH